MWSIASLLTAYGLDGVSVSSSAIGRPSRLGAYSELEPATTIAGVSPRSRIASNRPIVPSTLTSNVRPGSFHETPG